VSEDYGARSMEQDVNINMCCVSISNIKFSHLASSQSRALAHTNTSPPFLAPIFYLLALLSPPTNSPFSKPPSTVKLHQLPALPLASSQHLSSHVQSRSVYTFTFALPCLARETVYLPSLFVVLTVQSVDVLGSTRRLIC
jgi:hypothetical protein